MWWKKRGGSEAMTTNASRKTNKPSIVEIVERYVRLHRAGHEFTGLCPFHAEKTPSFFVNEEKGAFYCFGCGTGGDVIEFIKKIEGISFKEACKLLSLDTYKPKPRPHKAQAQRIVAWAQGTSLKLREVLCEIGDEIYICSLAREMAYTDKNFIAEHEAELMRQWSILCDLDDDVNNPKLVLELYAQRKDIERFSGGQ
jgi:DNA primase catalytic core